MRLTIAERKKIRDFEGEKRQLREQIAAEGGVLFSHHLFQGILTSPTYNHHIATIVLICWAILRETVFKIENTTMLRITKMFIPHLMKIPNTLFHSPKEKKIFRNKTNELYLPVKFYLKCLLAPDFSLEL
ncbi:hypothetical protein NPIL_86051 [Nephila pilipes]|uniref:Uncharacterized protein n=1 Tax=Nephila pilipes TaxID=299642 RepID=A0A8X6QY52_NEPPI|nr:hypothetical protein NPIL_86051 [Nephila pilipes]